MSLRLSFDYYHYCNCYEGQVRSQIVCVPRTEIDEHAHAAADGVVLVEGVGVEGKVVQAQLSTRGHLFGLDAAYLLLRRSCMV